MGAAVASSAAVALPDTHACHAGSPSSAGHSTARVSRGTMPFGVSWGPRSRGTRRAWRVGVWHLVVHRGARASAGSVIVLCACGTWARAATPDGDASIPPAGVTVAVHAGSVYYAADETASFAQGVDLLGRLRFFQLGATIAGSYEPAAFGAQSVSTFAVAGGFAFHEILPVVVDLLFTGGLHRYAHVGDDHHLFSQDDGQGGDSAFLGLRAAVSRRWSSGLSLGGMAFFHHDLSREVIEYEHAAWGGPERAVSVIGGPEIGFALRLAVEIPVGGRRDRVAP
jgi:hypothetical protein